jgi:hypothetical protein
MVDGLMASIRDCNPEGMKVPIFPISNKDYIAHLQDTTTTDAQLSKKDTMIPALLEHLHGVVAPTLMTHFEDFECGRRTVFFKGLKVWAYGSSVFSPDDLCVIVARPQQCIEAEFEGYLGRLKKAVHKHLVSPVYSQREDFIAHALHTMKEWKCMHWYRFRKYIRNDGTEESDIVTRVDYNKMFFELVVARVVAPNWKHLIRAQHDIFQELWDHVRGFVTVILQELGQEPQAQSLPLSKLSDLLWTQIDAINVKLRQHQEAMKRELANILTRLTQSEPDAFFNEAMAQTYTDSKAETGSGFKGRIMDKFDTKFRQRDEGNPFTIAANAAAQAIEDLAKDQGKILRKELDGIFRTIHKDFRLMIFDRVKDAQEKPVRDAVRKFFEERGPIDDDAKHRLEVLKSNYAMKVRSGFDGR